MDGFLRTRFILFTATAKCSQPASADPILHPRWTSSLAVTRRVSVTTTKELCEHTHVSGKTLHTQPRRRTLDPHHSKTVGSDIAPSVQGHCKRNGLSSSHDRAPCINRNSSRCFQTWWCMAVRSLHHREVDRVLYESTVPNVLSRGW